MLFIMLVSGVLEGCIDILALTYLFFYLTLLSGYFKLQSHMKILASLLMTTCIT